MIKRFNRRCIGRPNEWTTFPESTSRDPWWGAAAEMLWAEWPLRVEGEGMIFELCVYVSRGNRKRGHLNWQRSGDQWNRAMLQAWIWKLGFSSESASFNRIFPGSQLQESCKGVIEMRERAQCKNDDSWSRSVCDCKNPKKQRWELSEKSENCFSKINIRLQNRWWYLFQRIMKMVMSRSSWLVCKCLRKRN